MATYYIDYNATDDSAINTKLTPWKRCPGMQGFSGTYSHTAGDIFIFKGGVTWPVSPITGTGITIANSGSAGNVDTYTVDKTWFTGAAWDYPVFDGNMSVGQNAIGIEINRKSYIKIEWLKILDVGSAVDGSGCAIKGLSGLGHIEVANCWLQPEGVEAFSYDNAGADSATATGIYVHDCYITRANRCVVYAEVNCVTTDVQVYNNTMTGPGDLFSGGYHGDGWMMGFPNGTSTAACVTNVLFYGNKFIGDASAGVTAWLYSNGWCANVKVFNNLFTFENKTDTGLEPFITGMVNFAGQYGHDANIEVYNNTFSNDNLHGWDGTHVKGAQYGFVVGNPVAGTTVVCKNNIFSNLAIDVSFDTSTGATLICDYNLHNPDTSYWGYILQHGASNYTTIAAAQGGGFETHAPSVADPLFTTIGNGTTGSGDWSLQATSTAINAGADLSATFTTDITGATRSLPFDIGAFEYGGASTVSTPSISPAAGTYAGTQSITITCATSGASIRYTTDGSTPTSSSGTVYSGAISVASSLTIKAIAYKDGLTDSSVVSAAYTINAPPISATITSLVVTSLYI